MLLIDYSAIPRTGLKGKGSTDRIRAAGATIPEVQAARRQSDGSLLARLAENEYLILDTGPLLEKVSAFRMDGDNEPGLCPVPRFAGTTWLSLSGNRLDELFAKVCGVDLRKKVFANHRLAQTIVARTSATILRDDTDNDWRMHLVFDVTTSHYLHAVLLDAMKEYDDENP